MPVPKADDLARWRAAHVEALRLARALRAAAAVFRRHAGELKYQPQLGVATPVDEELVRAAETLRETLGAVSSLAGKWDEEITWMRSIDPATPVDDIQRGHAAAREAVRLLRAALEIFERAALHPEPATLDAPYGSGAPKRVHPGAQCTWVAERAETLSIELATVTLRKENLLLGQQRRVA
ncbi:MAG TPA: hypothetical protein VNN19_00385 [bacterium]|nr:hypothetical protein [bacterium]